VVQITQLGPSLTTAIKYRRVADDRLSLTRHVPFVLLYDERRSLNTQVHRHHTVLSHAPYYVLILVLAIFLRPEFYLGTFFGRGDFPLKLRKFFPQCQKSVR